MFWRRKPAPVPVSAPPAPPAEPAPPAHAAAPTAPTEELDKVLDVLADILRARARFAFGVGSQDAVAVASTFEQWAAHTLVRAPAPTGPKDAPVERRDWRGLVDFVTRHARREQEFVQGSTRDMGDAIFSLVDSVRRTSSAQGRQNELLTRKLSSLHVALASGSVEMLKREALAVASAVTHTLEEQQRLADEQARELKERLTALGEQLEQTRREGETDPLTRVANRRLFDVSLNRSVAVSDVLSRPLTLMMIDIDHFKGINDTHGHVVGDEVLRAVADVLSRTFPRRSDLVARYGGEEFAILLPDAGHEDVGALEQKLLGAIRAMRVPVGESEISLTVSVGVAVTCGGDAQDVVVRADRALYAAKRAGRDRLVLAGLAEAA